MVHQAAEGQLIALPLAERIRVTDAPAAVKEFTGVVLADPNRRRGARESPQVAERVSPERRGSAQAELVDLESAVGRAEPCR